MNKLLLAFILIICCATSMFGADTEEFFLPKDIVVSGLHSMSQEDFLDGLGVNAGSSFSAVQLRNGIKRLFYTGYFDDIIVKKADIKGEKIEIIAVENKIISKTNIIGNENFSDSFYLQALKVEKGGRLNLKSMEAELPNLLNRLNRRGYSRALISWTVNDLQYPYVELIINVSEGSPELIEKLVLNGPEDDLRYFLLVSEGDVYNISLMEQTKRKIMDEYKKRGHIGIAFSYNFDSGLLKVNLDPGKQILVAIHNNNNISRSKIMDELVFFDRNEFNDDLLEETLMRIKTFYSDNGFIKVKITPVTVYEAEKISLDLYIFEGSMYRLDKIEFHGSSLNKPRLYEILDLSPGKIYRPDAIESAAQTLEDFYRSLGYIYAEVEDPQISEVRDSNRVNIAFNVTEGVQVKISHIDIINTRTFSPHELMKRILIKPGDQYNEVDILDAKRAITDAYLKEGYLDVRVEIERDIKKESASIIFGVTEGEKIFFGKTVISGNGSTRPKVIKRELLHSEGMPADYEIVLSEKQNLYRLGLFSDVETELLNSDDGRKDVLYKLKEGNQGFVEFGAGYGEYEKARGFAEIGYRNLWGLNRQATLRTEVSTLEKRVLMTFTEPWFLNSKMPLKMLLLHENRKEKNIDTNETRYKLRRDTATVGIEKKISEKLTSELYYDFSVVKTTDVLPDIILSREDTGTLVISGLRAGLIYDNRDNPFEPTKGYVAGITAKWATELLFSETDFFKLTAYLNNFSSLSKRVVLAISGRFGYGKGLGKTDELPLVERFFLGGRTTVRGYEQDMLGPKGSNKNPTGGNSFAMANIELRTDIGKGLGIVTFFDAGDVWYSLGDISLSELKYTSGIGLRYKTPVGPIRVDYGVKLNKRESMSRGELHFSIGHAF
ncbi:MAG: outer membrane protein assembly factor BamA [Dissulfurispiraceae bacterium]|jgi:outer membrane protein insertion porin family|nr:outer membrane protein assembly factor BamA [Dissulfurispiraceae bacterium]